MYHQNISYFVLQDNFKHTKRNLENLDGGHFSLELLKYLLSFLNDATHISENIFIYCRYVIQYISIYFLSHGLSYKVEILIFRIWEVFIFMKYIVYFIIIIKHFIISYLFTELGVSEYQNNIYIFLSHFIVENSFTLGKIGVILTLQVMKLSQRWKISPRTYNQLLTIGTDNRDQLSWQSVRVLALTYRCCDSVRAEVNSPF